MMQTSEHHRLLSSVRVRKLAPQSFEESEGRALLLKQWSRYKLREHAHEMNAIHTAMLAQQVALQELRNESEELYQQAIQVTPRCNFVDQIVGYCHRFCTPNSENAILFTDRYTACTYKLYLFGTMKKLKMFASNTRDLS